MLCRGRRLVRIRAKETTERAGVNIQVRKDRTVPTQFHSHTSEYVCTPTSILVLGKNYLPSPYVDTTNEDTYSVLLLIVNITEDIREIQESSRTLRYIVFSHGRYASSVESLGDDLYIIIVISHPI